MFMIKLIKFCFNNNEIKIIVYRDLCTAFGAGMLPLVDKEPIQGLLTKGRRSKATKAKTLATWATKEIRKLKNASW